MKIEVAYIDTSVLLRIVLGERQPLREWRSIQVPVASELVRIEGLRTLDRARLRLSLSDADVAQRRADLMEVVSALHVAPLDRRIIERASDPFPTLLGTLDALHLATALRVRARFPEMVFATHDGELAVAARAVGFRVLGSLRPQR